MKKKSKITKSYSFSGQRENENVLFVFRKLIIAMRKGFYLLLVPFVISAIPPLVWQNNLELFIIPLIGLGIGLLLFFYHFILWYFSIYIVTNQRIRQITQRGFFAKDIVDLRLSRVQGITCDIPGFSGAIFHFGTIVIHTQVGNMVIHNVENPEKINDKLQNALDDAIEEKRSDEEIDQEDV